MGHWVGSVWFWATLGLVLLAAEAILPGAFLLWLGLAAGVVAALLWLMPDMGMTAQWSAFAVLALLLVGIGWRLRKPHTLESDDPLLNQRAARLVGRVLPLTQAIVNGRGQIRIDDAYWTVEGPELPVGTPVRIVAADIMLLRVVPV